jgi:hypothetical protein
MLFLYRCLLYLYPVPYRRDYGGEMTGVFRDLHGETMRKELPARAAFYAREFVGLLRGAWRERPRASPIPIQWISNSNKEVRLAFRIPFSESHAHSDGRYPGSNSDDREGHRDIRQSLPLAYPQELPPIKPEHFTFFPAMAVIFFGAYAAAAIGWIVLFALRRSGVHRLSEMDATSSRK